MRDPAGLLEPLEDGAELGEPIGERRVEREHPGRRQGEELAAGVAEHPVRPDRELRQQRADGPVRAFFFYDLTRPPSTFSVCPVMKAASSLVSG